MQINDDIIIRVFEGKATREELLALREWLGDASNRQYFEYLREVWNVIGGPVLSAEQEAEQWERFKTYVRKSRMKRVLRVCSGYAALFIILFAISFLVLRQKDERRVMPVSMQKSTIVSGSFQAILSVPGGKTIELKSTEAKRIEVGESGKAVNGEEGLVYERQEGTAATEYNQVYTPFGGEYSVVLADGTKVYMNSGSTLKFPVVFTDSAREVYLSGEAYFEVQKDSIRPFRVKTDFLEIKVYGTSFNVNTFQNTKTVLFSGSVGVKGSDRKEYILKPSQLIEYDGEGQFVEICDVDTRVYLAWKEGYFFFDNESLDNVLATLGRWYNVEFKYDTLNVGKMHFTGHIEKYKNIDVILDAIEKIVHVRFNIHGREIEVVK